MKALIISNGNINDYRHQCYDVPLRDADMVICADGGALHAQRMNIVPDIIMGDFDSIDPDVKEDMVRKGIEFVQYPSRKDETDTQIAVEYACQAGAQEITMIGCIGDRFDHTFANITLLKLLLDKGVEGKIIDEKNEIILINKSCKMNGSAGEQISLIPMTGQVSGICTEGLEYPLYNATIAQGSSRGISNVFLGSQAEVRLDKGLLLIVKARD